jgi:uncharacterized protein YndB with AHSA1/START domain
MISVKNPYMRKGVVKFKMILPVGKKRAWELIATPRGIASWLATTCTGNPEPGNVMSFGWPNGLVERFRVLLVGEKHSALRLQWRAGRILRFYLHGKLTTLTLEIHFPRTENEDSIWAYEMAQWAFFLANLKSLALKGPDLRNRIPARSWEKGFID